jgi:hypothetical protein
MSRSTEGRRLAGEELQARARELGATVSPRVWSAPVGYHQAATARRRTEPHWLRLRMNAQRRLFDIDRPERAAGDGRP